MVKDEDAVWKQDLYTPFGKWMDGWESRRRRTEGHDWCIVKLGLPGIVHAIEVDTAFFTGNFSPKVSIQGVALGSEEEATVQTLLQLRAASTASRPEFGRMGLAASPEEFSTVSRLQSDHWSMLVPLTPLGAGYEDTRRTVFAIDSAQPVSYLRVNMGPDGGIARIRVYGEVLVRPENFPRDRDFDLLAVEHGGTHCRSVFILVSTLSPHSRHGDRVFQQALWTPTQPHCTRTGPVHGRRLGNRATAEETRLLLQGPRRTHGLARIRLGGATARYICIYRKYICGI
jgi:hypothetical protein